MIEAQKKTAPSFNEFVIIVSLMMALAAFSIDAILPALNQVSTELLVSNPNNRQLVISVFFFGMALGKLFFGPLSDKIGRKNSIYIGYGAYILGAVVSGLAVNFPMMLAGRVLQGLGVSAPRSVTLALVRDQYEGNRMARVISISMGVNGFPDIILFLYRNSFWQYQCPGHATAGSDGGDWFRYCRLDFYLVIHAVRNHHRTQL